MARLAILALMLAFPAAPARAQSERDDMSGCELYRVTGYVRGYGSGRTFDGTSVWTSEPIAAASWNVPMSKPGEPVRVQVENVGTFRVADRGGGLSARHIDVLVDDVDRAYEITGWQRVCVL